MRFLAQLKQGFLPSGRDLNDVHPVLLSRYYGTEGNPRQRAPGQTGAGHYDTATSTDLEDVAGETVPDESNNSSDDDGSNDEDLELDEDLASDQQRHIRHPPTPVPGDESPFTDLELEELFLRCLETVRAQDIVPEQYGLTPEEWDADGYSEAEHIS